MPHVDLRNQKQQKEDERTLCLDELHHKDMEYQLKIKHVEYINRDTRGISLPNYDLKKHSQFRKRKICICRFRYKSCSQRFFYSILY